MHTHAGHSHNSASTSGPPRPDTRLALVFTITAGFMVVEAAGGVISGSLALLADAGHMLTDTLAIAMSWVAVWLARRAVSDHRTYGFKRAEILAAFINALLLVVLAGWIIREALERLAQPRPVLDGVLMAVAAVGLAVNVAGLLMLRSHAKSNITVRAAVWHILGDLLGSVGALTGGVIIHFTGWTTVDPIIGIGIAILIGIGSGRMLLDTTNMLLDSVPSGIDSVEVRAFLAAQQEVIEVCDLHIWAISATDTILTTHLVIRPGVERDGFQQQLLSELRQRFKLAHMTVQLENEPLETCDNGW